MIKTLFVGSRRQMIELLGKEFEGFLDYEGGYTYSRLKPGFYAWLRYCGCRNIRVVEDEVVFEKYPSVREDVRVMFTHYAKEMNLPYGRVLLARYACSEYYPTSIDVDGTVNSDGCFGLHPDHLSEKQKETLMELTGTPPAKREW